jgi:hypothetical protein
MKMKMWKKSGVGVVILCASILGGNIAKAEQGKLNVSPNIAGVCGIDSTVTRETGQHDYFDDDDVNVSGVPIHSNGAFTDANDIFGLPVDYVTLNRRSDSDNAPFNFKFIYNETTIEPATNSLKFSFPDTNFEFGSQPIIFKSNNLKYGKRVDIRNAIANNSGVVEMNDLPAGIYTDSIPYASGSLSIGTELLAELTDDNLVNLSDFAVLANNWGKTGQGLAGDISGPLGVPDGNVDGYDLAAFANDYLKPLPAGNPPPDPNLILWLTLDENGSVSNCADNSNHNNIGYPRNFSAGDSNIPGVIGTADYFAEGYISKYCNWIDVGRKLWTLCPKGDLFRDFSPGGGYGMWVSVVKDGSTYHAFYNDASESVGILHAISTDKINWTFDLSYRPVVKPSDVNGMNYMYVPQVWKEGDTWNMLVTAWHYVQGVPSSANGEIYYFKSTEGPTSGWTLQNNGRPVIAHAPGPAWNDSSVRFDAGAVIKEGSTYHCMVTTYPTNGSGIRDIGCYTSTDLITWTEAANNPVFNATSSAQMDYCPSIFKYGSDYYLLTSYQENRNNIYRHSFRLYKDSISPEFQVADRIFVKEVMLSDVENLNNGYTKLDVPFVLTDDINRNNFPDNQLYCYYSTIGKGVGLMYENDINAAVAPNDLSSLQIPAKVSFCCWINSWYDDDYQTILSKGWNESPWKLLTNPWGNLYFRLNNATSLTGHKNVCDGQWHFVTATYDQTAASDNMKIYVDGMLDAKRNYNAVLVYDNSPLFVGRCNTEDNWNGLIDNFMIFNRVLTSDEILSMYLMH